MFCSLRSQNCPPTFKTVAPPLLDRHPSRICRSGARRGWKRGGEETGGEERGREKGGWGEQKMGGRVESDTIRYNIYTVFNVQSKK